MVLLFSEPTQVLEYLRILNGAKFRWTMGEGGKVSWLVRRKNVWPRMVWTCSALGLLMSSESGSSVLKVILQHCWLMKKCPSQEQISRFCLLLPLFVLRALLPFVLCLMTCLLLFEMPVDTRQGASVNEEAELRETGIRKEPGRVEGTGSKCQAPSWG